MLLAMSIFDRLVAEEFEGSYPTVVPYVGEVRDLRFRGGESSIPIETGPGEEVQVDWVELHGFGGPVGVGPRPVVPGSGPV